MVFLHGEAPGKLNLISVAAGICSIRFFIYLFILPKSKLVHFS